PVRQPARVVFDSTARLPLRSALAHTARELPVIVLAGEDAPPTRVAALESPGSHRVMNEDVAAIMRDFMVSVVDASQANGVQIPGVKVGGKTGTAESGQDTSHAWFIAFAPADDPVIAVAVVVENGGQGGVVASPIAGTVIRAALAR
ncbi:MAG: penicillin-binding transpeptidase domain-containing protein, partial [Dehalococcoidia bacterium]